MSQLGSVAVSYAAKGIAVFPLQVEEKKPLGGTTGLLAASSDVLLTAERWAGKTALPIKPDWKRPVFAVPRCNVGIATGYISGFWALDLDGDEAETALAALQARYSPLPDTVEQSTGKGRHLCFAWEPARPIRNSASKIGAKIDVRGDGGYIVAPPSVHPSGRIYSWREGHSPDDMAFAPAPTWLLDLAAPNEPAPSTPRPIYRPPQREGDATRYGAAALTRACNQVASAPAGRQDDTLYDTSCSIGQLVAGGEIEGRYAASCLIDAGLSMIPNGRPWLRREVEDKVERAFLWGCDHPRSAPERDRPQAAAKGSPPKVEPSAGEVAIAARDARSLWTAARSAWTKPVTQWFADRGLDPGAKHLSDALTRFRAHPNAPYGRGVSGPALLAPMLRAGDAEMTAIAVLPLHGRTERFEHFVGDPAGGAIWLTHPDKAGPLLVAIDLQDAWTLAAHAGAPMRVVVAPLISSFAGGALGDRFGRIDPETPQADPARRPWLRRRPDGAGEGLVYLALRRDLRSPPLKARKALGGTRQQRLEGDAALKFYGAIAEQHWTSAGANAVRLLTPSSGRAGFNTQGRR